MEVMKFVGIGMVGAVLALLLRQHRPEFGLLVSLCCCGALLSVVLGALGEATAMVEELVRQGGIEEGNAQLLFKSLGICVMTQLASDACRDCGEGAIAAKVELAGKLAMLLVSLPLFSQLLTVSAGLLSL